MFKKLAIGLAAALLATIASGNASAKDKYVGLGAHFTWDNYKTPIVSTDAVNTGAGSSLLSSTEYGSPNFGGQVDFGLSPKLSLSLSVDFGFFSHKVYPYPGNVVGTGISSTTTNFWQVGPMIGIKYRFRDPMPGKVSLYLSGGFGKYFAGSKAKNGSAKYRGALKSQFYDQETCDIVTSSGAVEDNVSCDNNGDKLEGGDLDDAWNDWVDDNSDDGEAYALAAAYDKTVDKELEMIGKLASPWVIQLAIGAEFYATDTFALGADIFGLRFSFATADVGKVDGISMDDPAAAWTGKQNYINFYFYSALNLSFNLTGGSTAPAQAAGAEGSWNGAAAPAPAQAPAAAPQGEGDGWGDGWGANWSAGPPATATPATPAAPPPPPPPPAPEPAPAAPKASSSSGGSVPPPPPPPGY